MNIWQIAWRNLKRRKLRTLLTILSIVIGVGSALGVIASVDTAKKAFPLYMKEAFGKADFAINGTNTYYPEAVYAEAQKLQDTASVALLMENTNLHWEQEGIADIQKRVDLKGYSSLDTPLTDFKVLEGSLDDKGAVITDRTAKVLQLGVGDKLTFNTDNGLKTIPIAAVVRYTIELMGPSSWSMAKFHPWTIAVPLSAMQEWFGLSGKIESIQLKALDPSKMSQIQQQADTLAKRNGEVYVQPIVLDFDAQFKDANTFFLALYIAGFLGIALSGIVIFNTLYVSVKERKNEFAVLKTIGYTPEKLRSLVLYEVLLLSLIGTALGVLIGYGLALLLKMVIFMLFSIHDQSGISLTTGLIVSVLAGLLMPMAASLYPIRQAGKVSVIAVLKEEPARKNKLRKWQAIAGVLFIAASFFIKSLLVILPLSVGIVLVFPFLFKGFVLLLRPIYSKLFGFSGQVAVRNLDRNLGRTSATSVILCLGIAMIVLMSSLNTALIQSYEKVIHSTYGGNLDVMLHHIEDTDLATLRQTKGVASAQTYGLQAAIWNLNGEKRNLPVYGVGADWIDKFPLFVHEEQSPGELIKRLAPDEVILDNIAFGVWGGRIGDSITLETAQGLSAFKVAAVVSTMKNNGYGAFIGQDRFRESFGAKNERYALVIKDDAASPVQLRENIFAQFGTRIMSMFGPEDWVAVVGATYTGSFGVVDFLIILSIVISGMGITNTLLMNIMERIRELGMMRAVGVARKQVTRMVMLEGLGIGIAATLIGCLFGVALIYLTSTFMNINSLTYSFSVSWIIIGSAALFGLLVSLIASFTPARKASKTRLSEALRYE